MDSESETALNEAPRTTAAQRFLVLVFLAIVTSAGIIQTVVEARRGQWPQAFEIFADKPTASNLRAYEKSLEEASWVARRLRPWMQYARYVLLADAGRKALIGRDGWLFYKPGWDYLVERKGN
jgi:hypothetical protein